MTEPITKKGKHKQFDFTRFKQRHIALKILYFGWDYDGLAEQANNDRTIEYFLLRALVKTCLIESRQKCKFNRCGRTDKGVSSYGQVIDLNVRSNLIDETQQVGLFTPAEYTGPTDLSESRVELNYVDMLNGTLPDHIKVVAWTPVKQDFSSRHSCQGRSYSYVFPRGDLCIESMIKASQYLVGKHDFRNLCSFDLKNGVVNHERAIHSTCVRPITKTMSTIQHGDAEKTSDDSQTAINQYDFYEVVIVGRAFLYHQIRCIMTILFLVGRRREPPEVVRDLLDTSKCPARPKYCPASPLPLSLFDCKYDQADFQEWQYSSQTLFEVYKQLKQLWLKYKTKTVMIERVLFDIEFKLDSSDNLLDNKLGDAHSKQKGSWKDFGLEHDSMSDSRYVSLMKRSREDSLEEKLALMDCKKKKKKIEQEKLKGGGGHCGDEEEDEDPLEDS